MLLSGLQSQNEGAFAVDIGGFADDSARQFAHHCLGGSHEAEVWSAKGQRHTERLADGDVCTQLRRGFEQTQRNWVAAHDELSADRMNRFSCLFYVLDLAEEVRALDIQASGGLLI